MKSHFNPMKLKVLAVMICGISTLSLMGQDMSRVEVRFANPSYSAKNGSYTLDVELLAPQAKETLFGMNMRFFFDASLLEFKGIKQFHPGYNILGAEPKAYIGNASSGVQIFDLDSRAGYINTAVQLMDEKLPLVLLRQQWAKLCQVEFKVIPGASLSSEFCPSVIWDQKVAGQRGSFLRGSDGLVITVLEQNRSLRSESAPSAAAGMPFNWQYTSAKTGEPGGRSASIECVTIEGTVSTEDPDLTNAEGYSLFQNQPNPFDVFTTIDFILPKSQEASLIFYDASGAILEEVRGYYEKGRNQVLLKGKTWMNQSNVLYYLLKTDTYTSKGIPMTVTRA